MPWEGSELWVAKIAGTALVPGSARQLAGQKAGVESVSQPRWASIDGVESLVFLSDRTGFYELYRWAEGEEVRLLASKPGGSDVGGAPFSFWLALPELNVNVIRTGLAVRPIDPRAALANDVDLDRPLWLALAHLARDGPHDVHQDTLRLHLVPFRPITDHTSHRRLSCRFAPDPRSRDARPRKRDLQRGPRQELQRGVRRRRVHQSWGEVCVLDEGGWGGLRGLVRPDEQAQCWRGG